MKIERRVWYVPQPWGLYYTCLRPSWWVRGRAPVLRGQGNVKHERDLRAQRGKGVEQDSSVGLTDLTVVVQIKRRVVLGLAHHARVVLDELVQAGECAARRYRRRGNRALRFEIGPASRD